MPVWPACILALPCAQWEHSPVLTHGSHAAQCAHLVNFIAVFVGRPAPGCHPPRLFPRLHCWHGLLSRNTGCFMGRNVIGAMGGHLWGGFQLPVAPSQARGDFGVTPSVCLVRSRHPPGSERASCPLRPPTHLSPRDWLLLPWPAQCPAHGQTLQDWGRTGSGSWQMAGRLLTAHSWQHCWEPPSCCMPDPATSSPPGWQGWGEVPFICLRTPAILPEEERSLLAFPRPEALGHS